MHDPEEILKRIKEFARQALVKTSPRDYRPPNPEDFRRANILCFDQTLSNCGWAVLNTEHGHPRVSACGVIRPPAFQKGERGFEATFVKSLYLARDLRLLLRELSGQFDEVVGELPAVLGYRTESSLVAAVTLCQQLDEMGQDIPTFIPRQRAAAVLAGDGRASKTVSKGVVNDLVGARRPKDQPWNEHVHDAVFVGLMHLYRRPV
jgi:Holliday junction resolvasome RuvABC endonuclease subunit